MLAALAGADTDVWTVSAEVNKLDCRSSLPVRLAGQLQCCLLPLQRKPGLFVYIAWLFCILGARDATSCGSRYWAPVPALSY
jgi:hypothetical protein